MSSYTDLHYHLVFGTKNRTPWIEIEWRDRFHQYLGGMVRQLDGVAESVGGVKDHVHLLVHLKQSHRIQDFMRELKRGSSVWVHQTIKISEFEWQQGYGAFSVSSSQRPTISRYIQNQEDHHTKISFKEELEQLLKKMGITYKPKYLP
ncbi:IS200/IS605 family transposase [Persicirhabdus sediminis]|uniref:IS200/IS605 family transposase n=1 Tax=Persicirhabdus sediminis TaxID=454144 RepID=A0A8J7SLJ6_9BACT|nr:IS200/IS605 family transposase [Persicirhabdus sediminis]MBK1792854.1 IS200/IS605 family transposase [Persicirhabdus sediminis]